MEKDLTHGNTLKLIISFCIPLIGGAIFQQLYNVVDTMIVGRFVGVDALAAVGSTGSLNFLIIGFVLGLAAGFGIPIAQAFGAREEKKNASNHYERILLMHFLFDCFNCFNSFYNRNIAYLDANTNQYF